MLSKIAKNHIYQELDKNPLVDISDLEFSFHVSKAHPNPSFSGKKYDVIFPKRYHKFYLGLTENGNDTFESYFAYFDISASNFINYGSRSGLVLKSPLGEYEDLIQHLLWWIGDNVFKYCYELDGPDLWEQHALKASNLDISEINLDQNEPFNSHEKQFIGQALQQVIDIATAEGKFDPEQLKVLHNHILYLTNAVDRLSKTDWKSAAVGVILNLPVAMYVTHEHGLWLIDLFKHLLGSVPRFLV